VEVSGEETWEQIGLKNG